MSRFEKIMILFIVILFTSMSVAVIKTAHGEIEYIKEITEQKEDRLHLPSECEQYYDDGTDRWKECMGVGYK